MLRLSHLRDLTIDCDPGFISAASGLVRVGDWLHVVADDMLHLVSLRLDRPEEPGVLFPLLPGGLPSDPKARKAAKPDFESLVRLPASTEAPHGELLALGSGSRPNRCLGLRICLDEEGLPAGVHRIDLTPLYRPLANRFSEVNIEGAAVAAKRLVLFQRGNAAAPESAMIGYKLASALNGEYDHFPSIEIINLPTAGGVPLTITDVAICGGAMIFSAVAEDAPNAYDDGPLVGAAVGLLSPAGEVLMIEHLQPAIKVEGISACPSQDGLDVDLLLVSDADDPAVAAALYATRIRPAGR